MSLHRRPLIAALLVLAAVAGQAHAASTTMSVGLVLRAPGTLAESAEGAINPAGRMRAEGMHVDALERAIAQAPRVERTGELQADGSRLHSIQY